MQVYSFRPWFLILLLCLGIHSCRKDEEIVLSKTNRVIDPYLKAQIYRGVYILNEGTMGRNIASIDFFDYTTGKYQRNIFPERNPFIARELGDVGNDLKMYQDELWAVINSSNLVEVMDAETAQHKTQISIANARYLAFHDGFAYVSSYAGPVGIDPNARVGKVIKINVRTKQIVGECLVGYQPEEMAVMDGKLYVANSGGYRKPNYDNRLSVIDLKSFTLDEHIAIGINLHRLKADSYGRLWISSRGDHRDIPSNLYVYDTKLRKLISPAEGLGIACSDMTIVGDRLYLYGGDTFSSLPGGDPKTHFMSIDVHSLKIIDHNLLREGARTIRRPYGIAVNSEQNEVLIADAGDYTAPGRVLCFNADGRLRWEVTAGVIPSRFVFTSFRLKAPQVHSVDPDLYPNGQNPYANRVIAYRPAPGQFVNKMPMYQEGDSPERMRQKAEQAIARIKRSDSGSLITLGAWGGYVIVAFDHRVENKTGLCDFRVLGNTFEGGSEPGVIYVAQDTNDNGTPDEDEWRRICGSAEYLTQEPFYSKLKAQGEGLELFLDYVIRYERPLGLPLPTENEVLPYIPWQDNKGRKGFVYKNSFNVQNYYPEWLKDEEALRFDGVRLPTNVLYPHSLGNERGIYIGYSFSYGYADNAPNNMIGSAVDIDWAVDAQGNPAMLSGIDFIKVQTGVQSHNGSLGESSTEVAGFVDLHLLGQAIPSPHN